nr:hypothetical protein [Raoultella ornithinolytica]
MREILISESAWEEMTCLFAPSLEKACKDMVHLSPDLVISVNISAVEFNTRGLAKRVKAALQKSA